MNARHFSLRPFALHIVAAIVACGTSPLATPQGGNTLWVANDGVDSVRCGNRAFPCRSISQAMENAANGDTIAVGAGLYGDLNGDGDFKDAGEEHLADSSVGGTCIVCVTKSLTILSLHGAGITVIDAANGKRPDPTSQSGIVAAVVAIDTDTVTFGGPNSGFTVTGSANVGIAVHAVTNVRLTGNAARGNGGAGFRIQASDSTQGEDAIVGNLATGNAAGFVISRDETRNLKELMYVSGNTAAGNSADGFTLSGCCIQFELIANTASNNGVGIRLDGVGFLIQNNTVTANQHQGIHVSTGLGGSGLAILGNTIVGNRGPGIQLNPDAQGNTIERNNIFGNWGTEIVDGPNPGGTANCGVVNTGFAQLPPSRIDATNNFWGSPSGPGKDPADNAGPGCDFNGGTTIVKPFATTLFPINP
jgi:parallel beta-helix repeat protein